MIQKSFLAILLIFVGISAGFSQEQKLKEFEKEFIINKRYLIWPVKDKAEKQRFYNHLDGSLLSFIDVELAPGEPDHWYFTDLSQYQGSTILIHASLPEHLKNAFNRIVLSDKVPGMENVYHETLRSQFHFSSKRGWNNDPNGLMYYEGEYHLFYQHNPYGWAWHNMHWGHAVSKDLVHWKELPAALYSDVEGYMYSGSGAVDFNNTLGFQKGNDKTLICFYSSNGNHGFIPGGKMSQSIAFSLDRGHTWTKYQGNPVLPKITMQNRDPKVIWYKPGKHWVMSLYLDKPNESYALFTSEDLINWEMSDEYYIEGSGECPDIFEIPMEGHPGESRWIIWGARGIYKVGSFDGKKFTPESESVRLIWGNAYAGQTFDNAPDGRRIHIAWMANGNPGQPGMPFNQHMSLPMDFTLTETEQGPRLRANPANEIEIIRTIHNLRRAFCKTQSGSLSQSIPKPSVPFRLWRRSYFPYT